MKSIEEYVLDKRQSVQDMTIAQLSPHLPPPFKKRQRNSVSQTGSVKVS